MKFVNNSRYRSMKATKNIVVNDATEAIVRLLLHDVAIPDKLIQPFISICRNWKPNSHINADFKNAICAEVGYGTKNKHVILDRAIHELTDIHITLDNLSSPLILPTKFLKRDGIRHLKLHPKIEILLSKMDKVNEVQLLLNFVWKPSTTN